MYHYMARKADAMNAMLNAVMDADAGTLRLVAPNISKIHVYPCLVVGVSHDVDLIWMMPFRKKPDQKSSVSCILLGKPW